MAIVCHPVHANKSKQITNYLSHMHTLLQHEVKNTVKGVQHEVMYMTWQAQVLHVCHPGCLQSLFAPQFHKTFAEEYPSLLRRPPWPPALGTAADKKPYTKTTKLATSECFLQNHAKYKHQFKDAGAKNTSPLIPQEGWKKTKTMGIMPEVDLNTTILSYCLKGNKRIWYAFFRKCSEGGGKNKCTPEIS